MRRVATLVESYLHFGRLPEPRLATVQLDALVDAKLATIASDLGDRGIVVLRERAPDPPAVSVDPEQLGQAFVNLFRNAMEAMPAGGTLTVVTSGVDGVVMVEVADTGPGVPPDDAERIFRPFHTTKPFGSGLGLAIAREIV